MELVVKHFSELSAAELADIYELRVAVFVVEQRCPYQEVDRADREAYHVWLRSQAGIEAYLRVLPRGVSVPDVSIGRVVAVRRRQGLGSRILAEGMRVARERLGAGGASCWKRRCTRAGSMKRRASGPARRSFWRTGYRT